MTTDTRHASTTTATIWRLDPEASSAEFHVRTFWGATTIHGSFERVDGAFEDGADAGRCMTLDIAAASLQTGNPRRDEHLRSADFFDCERHPGVRFRSIRVGEIRDGRLQVEGELEAAGRRVPLRLEPTVTQQGDGGLEIHAEATVDQHELGMTSRKLGIRSPARLTVHARLRPADR